MSPLVAANFVGFKKETVWGTAVVPDLFLPVNSVTPEVAIARILDAGKRAIAAKDFASYAGAKRGKLGFEGLFYDDIPARLIHGILGADTITGAADPWTHTLKLADTAPSFTIADYDAVTADERRYAGMLVSGCTIRFSKETGALEYSVETEGKVPTDTAKSTPTFAGTPYLGWQATATIAAVGNTDVLGAEIAMKRTPQLVYGGSNSQDPNRGFAGGDLEVTGKISFYAADDVILDYYRNATQPIVSLKLDRSVTPARTVEFLMSKCDFEKVDWDRSGEYVRWDATFRALYNTTDGGPIQVVVLNGVSVAF